MKNINTVSFWNKKIIRGESLLLRSPIYLDKNKIVERYFRDLRGRLLDIGLGYGVLENLLKDRIHSLKFFGIDISPVSVKKVSKIVQGEFVVASAMKIPFQDMFFDYVVVLDVLEHFYPKELTKVLLEVKRVLKGKGILIVSVPLNESLKDKRINRHMISFTDHSIIELLSKSGFEITEKKLLFAFKNGYVIKSLLARIFRLKRPNLVIIFCKKK
ncbi:MAG: class I SAM-dependent methyltransferase [Patescibacteria group bacterium]